MRIDFPATLRAMTALPNVPTVKVRPPFALVPHDLDLTTDEKVAQFLERLLPAARGGRTSPALALVPVIALTVYGFVETRDFIRRNPSVVTSGDPGPQLASVIPKGACVVTDQPARMNSPALRTVS